MLTKDTKARSKTPFRFSLLGLFALVTIVALTVSHYQTSTRLASYEAEVDRLRREVGYLTISDPNKVHVIAVPTSPPMTWRWRIYLPGGDDFAIYQYRGKLDAKGYPAIDKISGAIPIGGESRKEPREVVVDLVFSKTLEGDSSSLWLSEDGKEKYSFVICRDLPTWLHTSVSYHEKVTGQRNTVVASADQPIGLITLDGQRMSDGTTCDDAVMMWIMKLKGTQNSDLRSNGILPGE